MVKIRMWPKHLPKSSSQPPVSILTPTYNRRNFLPHLYSYILSQQYPIERMEWVILDDGTDTVRDLVETWKADGKLEIQYIRSDVKLNIGAKRNRLHTLARGEILVNMDDDDYYMPTRVSHAVVTLRGKNGKLAGSSQNHLYYMDDGSIWAVGPYAPNHATFGTMAYTKGYAVSHPCDESKLYAEEVEFTNRYSEPLLQLDPMKVMLVRCHSSNTFDKSDLRKSPSPVMKKTGFTLKTFISKAADRTLFASK
jgi:glycosyltransferase involved in cell wall biosynthesis